MDQDLAVQISRVRNILRKTLQAGHRTPEAEWALSQLEDLARRGDDGALAFEHLRWRFHLAALATAQEAA
jgi:hypothetical protein